MPEQRVLGDRFSNAAHFASELHAGQVRKGTPIPYVSHVLSVAALVLEDGGSEDEAIAGLLHDAIEDQARGNPDSLRQEIAARFGNRVLEIVAALTDSETVEKGPWRPRKEAYLARLATEPQETLRVAAADKLHNARSILADYRVLGEALWSRFNAGPEDTRWYYTEVERLIARGLHTRLAARLHEAVAELQRVIDGRATGDQLTVSIPSSIAPQMILIAGPYRSGTDDDPARMARNVEVMEAFALSIFREGHIPVVGEWLALPLVRLAGSTRVGDAAFDEIFHPIAVRLLGKCDAVLRVSGPSTGADEMVRTAQQLGLQIYRTLDEIPGCTVTSA